MAGAERIFEVMDTDPEPYAVAGTVPPRDIQGTVTFQNVRFGYDKSNPYFEEPEL
jgi:ATP-binding cassette subfamily B protein